MATPPLSQTELFTDAQLGNDRTIALNVLLGQIVQHLAALTDHFQQAAAAVVVVDVDLQVLGELLNPGGEDIRLRTSFAILLPAKRVKLCKAFSSTPAPHFLIVIWRF